jgi:hypothetical protein
MAQLHPLGRQHVPPPQTPLQQSLSALHAAPGATHVVRVQVPPSQSKSPQQSFESWQGWPLLVH